MEGIQAHWIQNVQKSLTPILQLKINLWCACPEKGIQVWLKSAWMMDQEQSWRRWAVHTEEQLATQEVYVFCARFSMAMQTPSLCLVGKDQIFNPAQNWGSRACPSCRALLLPSAGDAETHRARVPGTWTRSKKLMGVLPSAPKSIASISAAMRKPDTASSFSLNKNKGI